MNFEWRCRLLNRGLVIDEPWIGLILLSGKKTWEMRSTNALNLSPKETVAANDNLKGFADHFETPYQSQT